MNDERNYRIDDALRAALLSSPRRETAVMRLAAVWPVVLEARAAGVRWADIGLRLAAVGVTRADGQPFTPATLVWAAGRLDGKPRPQTPKVPPAQAVAVAPALVSAPSKPIPTPRPRPEASASIFDEVEALLAQPSGQPPTPTIDEFLKEKERGKSKS